VFKEVANNGGFTMIINDFGPATPKNNPNGGSELNQIEELDKELHDSYGVPLTRGFIGLSFIGFSGSGGTQHMRRAKISFNPAVGYTIGHKIECPGHHYKRGTPLIEVVRAAEFTKMISSMPEFSRFPVDTMIVFSDDFPFKDLI
jgi:hypothetical protein